MTYDTHRILPRFLETERTRRDHADKLARVAADAAGARVQPEPSRSAADGRTLRGIPAIGRGVAGVIGGTQPGGPD